MKISKVLGEAITDLESSLASAREAASVMTSALESGLARLREAKVHYDRAMTELTCDTPIAPVQPTPQTPPIVTPPPAPEPVAPAPVQPAPVVPSKPPTPIAGPVPVGSDRVIPDGVWAAVDLYAPQEQVNPDVLLAIEVWETGWFTSDAWKDRRNPGGMKNPPASFATHGLVTDRDPEHPTYMRFSSWSEGIRGHAVFLGKGPRYAGIHQTTDPDRQIEAIGHWPAKPDAAPRDAEEGWLQALTLHRRKGTLHKELKDAEAALAEDPSEANLARLVDIQSQLASSEGTEALIEGFGASSGRERRVF